MKYPALPRTLTSLRSRNFRLYWFGQLISLIGSSMQTIGLTWLVLELTHSPVLLGLLGTLQLLPVLLFSLFGGVFVDRWPRRRLILFTQSAAMLQALLLWVLIVSGALQLWHIYVLAVLLGLTSCLDRPARSAFVVEMVGRGDLPNALALNFSIMTLARVVGPSLGGLIIAALGVPLLFLLNAISFLAVIVALGLMRSRELYALAPASSSTSEGQSTWQSLREGLAYCWRTPPVLLVIVVVGLILLFGSNFNVILPLFATYVLHIGAAGFGFLSAALGLGALLSTLWLAWGNRQPTIRAVLIYTLIFGILEIVFAMARLYPLSLLLMAVIGFAETAYASQAITLLQIITPDHLQGRVMSVSVLFFDGSVPLGYMLTGWLSALYGAPLALLICALFGLLVAGAGWIRRNPAERHMAALAASQKG